VTFNSRLAVLRVQGAAIGVSRALSEPSAGPWPTGGSSSSPFSPPRR
jgi:hypothetical protein